MAISHTDYQGQEFYGTRVIVNNDANSGGGSLTFGAGSVTDVYDSIFWINDAPIDPQIGDGEEPPIMHQP